MDVPAQLAARARLLNTGRARKTDPIDATSVATVAQHHRRLHPVQAEDHSVVLRLLSERRDDLAEERTRTANRLHALLRDLLEGGAKRNLTVDRAVALLRRMRPATRVDEQRTALARDLVADLRRLDTALERNATDIAAAVTAHGTTVTQIHGVGPVLAAKIVGHTRTVVGFPADTTTPATAAPHRSRRPPGDQRRHRLSRAGNRQLNRALHLVAVCQIRTSGPGRDF
ncbi:IS110 family transposase [Pseudonocardia kunmingensis]|uniref:IS110 family transposase n=1 Tax=Pseudonocardia kunmingensis TaxID=630975 RepID=UPI00115003BD|nr:transposase [Pseudonocardia kunmingensis]